MKNEKLNKAIDGLNEELAKAKKMPIGTVSKGYKKVAEGKWVPVKDSKIKNIKDNSKEYDPMEDSIFDRSEKFVLPKQLIDFYKNKKNKEISGRREAARDGIYKMTNEDWENYNKYEQNLKNIIEKYGSGKWVKK